MKVHLTNIGCKVNFADLSQIKTLLIENNYTITSEINDADIVLINTCAVTYQATKQSRQTIRSIKGKNPTCFIGVLGCYAQLAASEILETTGADAVFGINEKFKIHLLLAELIAAKSRTILAAKAENLTFDIACSASLTAPNATSARPCMERTRVFIKLQDGCDYKCSYCVVPLVRGASRSAQFKLIPGQISKLINAGYKEIVISGINLSDYKGENGESFFDLLKLLDNVDKYCEIKGTSNVRFRISSIEPQVLSEELIELIANSKYICPHFHIPLQSGSDEVLNQMQRRYNTRQFRQHIELINRYIPRAFIGLDVISGFPTETEQAFRTTKDFINSLEVSALHCFTYSTRQGTPAAAMAQLPGWQKKQRTNELIELSKQKRQVFVKKNIGSSSIVLSEKYDSVDNLIWGYTENYIRVSFHSDIVRLSDFYPVKLISVVSLQNGALVTSALQE